MDYTCQTYAGSSRYHMAGLQPNHAQKNLEEQQLKAGEVIIKPILPRHVRNHFDWHPNI
jgi:hypothetical protein